MARKKPQSDTPGPLPAPLPDRVELRAIDSLTPYAENPRTHSDGQITQIAESIRRFGWTNPILVDRDGGVLAGHGRLLAARALGLEVVPVIQLDHLTEVERRAYVIADNQLALGADWDSALLTEQIRTISQENDSLLSVLGFDDVEIQGFLGDFPPGNANQGTLKVQSVVCPECGCEFTPD